MCLCFSTSSKRTMAWDALIRLILPFLPFLLHLHSSSKHPSDRIRDSIKKKLRTIKGSGALHFGSEKMSPGYRLIASLASLIAALGALNLVGADRVPVGLGLGGMAYWAHPVFADAFKTGRWLTFQEFEWGNSVDMSTDQFVLSLPQYLIGSEKLRCMVFGLHSGYPDRPENWPDRTQLLRGRWVLEWTTEQGAAADIRLTWCQIVTDPDGFPNQGPIAGYGRRVYDCAGNQGPGSLTVESLTGGAITSIHVWMPDPEDPLNSALEQELFHPTYIARLNEADWEFIRGMDLTHTNNNPQRDWIDRRLPADALQTGVINPRSPAPEYPWVSGNQDSGISYEYLVQIANEVNEDLWINIPHMATNDFVQKLAQLLRFGSDGVNPYSSFTENPVYQPLNPSSRIFVEYSNEIWSSGPNFAQGEWAADEGANLGLSKAVFNARKFCDFFNIFRQVFAEEADDRVQNVAAIFSANDAYTNEFLDEMESYCPSLDPSLKPDILSPTTYFGNGIQDFVFSQDWWNYQYTDPYWNDSEAFLQNINLAFDEWTLRLLSGNLAEGDGPDATGLSGGFPANIFVRASQYPQGPLDVVSYEGGPSVYTDGIEGSSIEPNKTGITIFMEAMNRHERMEEVYYIHLNRAWSKGLKCHGAFTETSRWGKFGQWGHLEFIDQEGAVKWNFMKDALEEFQNINPVSLDSADPQFLTQTLSNGRFGDLYNQSILLSTSTSETLTTTLIGSYNVQGLEITMNCPSRPNEILIQGVVQHGVGQGYLYFRAIDSTGDASWNLYQINYFGHPNVLYDSDFSGENPSSQLPWTKTQSLCSSIDTVGGWVYGSGYMTQNVDIDNMLSYKVNSPSEPATLDWAIANQHWMSLSLILSDEVDMRGASVTFTILRGSYHAPREYAVYFSKDGNIANVDKQVFDTGLFTSESPKFFSFTLPDESYYLVAGGSTVEFRIYSYAGQWGSKQSSLMEFSVSLDQPCGEVEEDVIAIPSGFGCDDTSSNGVCCLQDATCISSGETECLQQGGCYSASENGCSSCTAVETDGICPGDVDANGVITIADIVLSIQVIIGAESPFCGPMQKALVDLSDVDGNGFVDIADVILTVECTTIESCCNV